MTKYSWRSFNHFDDNMTCVEDGMRKEKRVDFDTVLFSNNHVQTNASFISAGWVSAGFIAQQLAKEGARGHVLFDDACLHLIALNYLLHNMGFFARAQHGAFDLKISLETLLSAWQSECKTIVQTTPPEYAPVEQYFRIMEATALLGTCWHFEPNSQHNAAPQLGMVRGMNLIYPSLWLLTLHWFGRQDLVHFDRRDFSMLEIAETNISDNSCRDTVLLPYPPRLPLSSQSTPISG